MHDALRAESDHAYSPNCIGGMVYYDINTMILGLGEGGGALVPVFSTLL